MMRIAAAGIVALLSIWGAVMVYGADERVLALILVKSKAEADALMAAIGQGQPFEQLAREHSLDPSASEGGYLGKVNLAELREELRQAVSGVEAGGVSRVFATGAGYMIVKVLPRAREDRPRGAVQIVAYLSGYEESLHYFSKLPKPANFHQDLQAICALKKEAIESALRDLRRQLASATDPQDLVQAHHTAAQLTAYHGDFDKTIPHLEEALRIATERGMDKLAPVLREKLGIAWLRKGEIENCISNHNARSCIFPLTAEARHKLQTGSRRAVAFFKEYLQGQPGDLEVGWLLDLGLMTLGLPTAHMPGPSARTAEFVDVSHAAGLHRMNNAGGSILEDFDNDGRLDLAISVVNACEPMGFYRNEGEGRFVERTQEAGLASQLGGININQTDYDNDGWLDIFVMRGGWEFPMRNSLLRNTGKGAFEDVTAQAGLALPAYPTPTAAWADFDNDGWVDLFVGNENAPGQLFRNQGNGTFSDVAAKAGVGRSAFAKSAVWGDYDNDGYPDLYVSNYQQENFLYHNNRDGTFTEVAKALGVEHPIASFPAWFFDYDNDGCLDLFVSSYVQSVAEIAAEFRKLPIHGETMRLYRNTCRGAFDDVTAEAGLQRISMAMGANFGDIDNDGYLDFYLGTGSPSYGALAPNLLFRNDGGRRFEDVTAATGTGHLQKGHGIAFGDFDGDGNQDIFLHSGGAVPGDTYGNSLFRNPGTRHHWLRLKLVGRKTNRAAIGARIKVTVSAPESRPRSIHRTVTSGGSFGASSFAQHVGMGDATRVDRLDIWWPTSNTRQTFENVAAGQVIEITEGEPKYRRLSQ